MNYGIAGKEPFKQARELLIEVPFFACYFTMLENYYIVILKTVFENLSSLKLKTFPGKEKSKIVVLTKITEQLEHGKQCMGKELNQILKEIYDHYAVIKGYLVDYSE
ncbi:DUF2087 domain-containing protein [Clostridium sp. JNZ X4-2]|jgi:hypothetical protein